MANPRTTNVRTPSSSTDIFAPFKEASLVLEWTNKVGNLTAQLKVLRRWKDNAKGKLYDGSTFVDFYVTVSADWFDTPTGKAKPFLMPNTSQKWIGGNTVELYKQSGLGNNKGRFYVFKDIPFTNQMEGLNSVRRILLGDIKAAIGTWNIDLAEAKKYLQEKTVALQTPSSPAPKPPADKGFITKADLDAQPVLTNVGSVREAYFTARTKAEDVENAIKKTIFVEGEAITKYIKGYDDSLGTNAPSSIRQAAELWTSALGSKGMFVTYFPPNGYDDSNSDSSKAFDRQYDLTKYGFQFMYNPTTISMDYFSTQNVDVAFQMSGEDKFNYVPTSGNSGAITFQILINRIFDMPYYVGGKNGKGALISGAEKFYSPRAPYGENYKQLAKDLFNEQDAIYNKGTMYDIEFLLRTLLGFKMKSALRREYTADMGFYSRKMVDLHLGPRMRYRGYVNSLHIDHAMFNERMVPTLSRVSITFNRFPDYPNTGAGLPGDGETTDTVESRQTAAETSRYEGRRN